MVLQLDYLINRQVKTQAGFPSPTSYSKTLGHPYQKSLRRPRCAGWLLLADIRPVSEPFPFYHENIRLSSRKGAAPQQPLSQGGDNGPRVEATPVYTTSTFLSSRKFSPPLFAFPQICPYPAQLLGRRPMTLPQPQLQAQHVAVYLAANLKLVTHFQRKLPRKR